MSKSTQLKKYIVSTVKAETIGQSQNPFIEKIKQIGMKIKQGGNNGGNSTNQIQR